jgi:epoxyqueuosine reductase
MDPHDRAIQIRNWAYEIGFAHIAFSPVGEVPRHDFFTAWLAADRAGEMDYLRRDAGPRQDPGALLPLCRTIVCVAVSYQHPVPAADPGIRGQIARYAHGQDYHLLLRRRLQLLGDRIEGGIGRALARRVCVDTAPLLEREIAARAGLGFQAKNTLLITPGVGSYTVLGELLLDVEVATGTAIAPRCGACTACLSACPTGALSAYQIDARRCISYLTIELQGAIPVELRPLVGTWIFGCDICQEVCPWNAAGHPGDPALKPSPRPGTGSASRERYPATPELVPLLSIGAAQFRKLVKRTALRRINRGQLLRNVAVALGNVGTAGEVPALFLALSREGPLVRRHVAWALSQIAGREPAVAAEVKETLVQGLGRETDPEVREEIATAIRSVP